MQPWPFRSSASRSRKRPWRNRAIVDLRRVPSSRRACRGSRRRHPPGPWTSGPTTPCAPPRAQPAPERVPYGVPYAAPYGSPYGYAPAEAMFRSGRRQRTVGVVLTSVGIGLAVVAGLLWFDADTRHG